MSNSNAAKMGAIKLGTKNRQSKFSSLEATNMVAGFAPVLDKESKVTEYRWNFVTKIKLGNKSNYRTGFVSCSIEEHEAIMKTLKITDGDLLEGNDGYMKLVDSEGKNAPKLQSLLDGLTLSENKFDSKQGVQIRIYSDIFAGVENAVYTSVKHACEMVRNEAITKKGIRCFTSADGDVKPVYVEDRPFWSNSKDRNGKLVADTSMIEALAMCNAADTDGVVWSYDAKVFINPYDLVQFYQENDIVCTDLQSKIDAGVFSELEGENAPFDWANFDAATIADLPSAKLFIMENTEFLGTIVVGNKQLAALRTEINKAVKEKLASIA